MLFADEPTGSLDSLTGEQVMDLLVDHARRQGTTVVIVTHEPRVAAYADREVIVRDGRVSDPVHAPEPGARKVISLGTAPRLQGWARGERAPALHRPRRRPRRRPALPHALRASTGSTPKTCARAGTRRPQRIASRASTRAPSDPLWWTAHHRSLPRGRHHARRRGRPQVQTLPRRPGLTQRTGAGRVLRVSGARETARQRRRPISLRDRLPGRQAGLIAADALSSPDSLVAIVGRTPERGSRPARRPRRAEHRDGPA